MFLLYHGSGYHEVQLVHELNPAVWALLRKKALSYLTLLSARESAKLLSELPFEHWEGTNSFGDETRGFVGGSEARGVRLSECQYRFDLSLPRPGNGLSYRRAAIR